MKMKATTVVRSSKLLAIALLLGATSAHAGYAVLRSFNEALGEAAIPTYSNVTLSGSTMYGMTRSGGTNYNGAIFSMNTDGTGYSTLFSFNGASGYMPNGSLTLVGSTLYGMNNNDAVTYGKLFSVNTSGTGFAVLHSFVQNDGRTPSGSLTLSGSTLYGMTQKGGINGQGAAFSMNADGTSFTALHSFANTTSDGKSPYGDLTLAGSKLYGMTQGGGANGQGTVFSMSTDGTGFALLHSFANNATDAGNPFGNSLTLSGSKLYGMTQAGGDNPNGAVGAAFSMNLDGSDYAILHFFAGGTTDGSSPYGNLTLSGSTLYGLTALGGANNLGTMFSMDADGSDFTLLHSFAGGGDGSGPMGSLTLAGSMLYGMTKGGGTTGNGTVFSYEIVPVPEPAVLGLLALGGLTLLRRRPRRPAAASPNAAS